MSAKPIQYSHQDFDVDELDEDFTQANDLATKNSRLPFIKLSNHVQLENQND